DLVTGVQTCALPIYGQPVDCSSRAVEELGRRTAYAVQRVAGGTDSSPRSVAFCKYKRRHVMTPRRPDLDHLDREMRDHIEEETQDRKSTRLNSSLQI